MSLVIRAHFEIFESSPSSPPIQARKQLTVSLQEKDAKPLLDKLTEKLENEYEAISIRSIQEQDFFQEISPSSFKSCASIYLFDRDASQWILLQTNQQLHRMIQKSGSSVQDKNIPLDIRVRIVLEHSYNNPMEPMSTGNSSTILPPPLEQNVTQKEVVLPESILESIADDASLHSADKTLFSSVSYPVLPTHMLSPLKPIVSTPNFSSICDDSSNSTLSSSSTGSLPLSSNRIQTSVIANFVNPLIKHTVFHRANMQVEAIHRQTIEDLRRSHQAVSKQRPQSAAPAVSPSALARTSIKPISASIPPVTSRSRGYSSPGILSETFSLSVGPHSGESITTTDPSNIATGTTCIHVAIRQRPLSNQEKEKGEEQVVFCKGNQITVHPVLNYEKKKEYSFNRVYDPSTSQDTIFQEVAFPLVLQTLEGYNCTIFAYGQTGSGKTFTMEGKLNNSTENPEAFGIIPRSVESILLQQQEKRKNNKNGMVILEQKVYVSHLEIYNEELQDLLFDPNEPDQTVYVDEDSEIKSLNGNGGISRKELRDPAVTRRLRHVSSHSSSMFASESDAFGTSSNKYSEQQSKKLSIAKDAQGRVFIKNLREVEIHNVQELLQVLRQSIQRRQTAETGCNKKSSRSHAVFIVKTICKQMLSSGMVLTISGRLNLVDLSGSENYERAGSRKDRQMEACYIGQGLLALGRVIKALVEKWAHVPYRESKLTRILEESLGGDTLTTMILTVAPTKSMVDETVSTLNYATLARQVQNIPTKKIIKTKTIPVADSTVDISGSNHTEEEVDQKDRDADCEAGSIELEVPVLNLLAFVNPFDEGHVPIKSEIDYKKKRIPADHPIETKTSTNPGLFSKAFHASIHEWVQITLLTKENQLSKRLLQILKSIFKSFDTKQTGILTKKETKRIFNQVFDINWSKESNLNQETFIQYFDNILRSNPIQAYKILDKQGYLMSLEKKQAKNKAPSKEEKKQHELIFSSSLHEKIFQIDSFVRTGTKQQQQEKIMNTTPSQQELVDKNAIQIKPQELSQVSVGGFRGLQTMRRTIHPVSAPTTRRK